MKHQERYEFRPPRTLTEAKERLRSTTLDIMNVEKQLGDTRRKRNKDERQYEEWREKSKAAKIFMVAEKMALEDWILERRRQLDSKKVGIWPHNDPRSIIQRAVIEGRKALRALEDAGVELQNSDLAAVLDLADTFLNHDA